jgi:GGDEF domain-containing protein
VPRALSLVVPEGLVVLAAVALARFGASIEGFRQVAEWLPAILLLAGFGLAWRFGRGRLFASLAIIATFWGWILAGGPWEFRPFLALALALVLLTVGWSKERGARGVYVLALIAGLVLIGGGFLVLMNGDPTNIAPSASGPLAWTGLPEWGGGALAAAALGLLVASLIRGDGVAQGALWATVAGWGALVIEGRAGALTLVAGAAAAVVTGTLESIYSAAYRDALTGLPSRRALDERLAGLASGVVVAMVDVDHFKQFNDTHGHDTGDQVLRMVAWRLADVRDAEAFRYGGEEFTLVFNEMSLPDALARLEGARGAVAASKFMLRSGDRPKGKQGKQKRGRDSVRHGLSVTISIGAAARKDGEHPAALLKRADDALYAAKEAGRDRVLAAK